MDQSLAKKIIKEVEKFSKQKYAVLGELGDVLAKTKSFTIKHKFLETNNERTFKLSYQEKNCGYVYIDEPLEVVAEIGIIIKSLAELIIQQERYTKLLTSDEKRINQLAYNFFFLETSSSGETIKILRSFGINLYKKRVAILIEFSNPSYLKLYEKEVVEGERENIITRTKRGIESTLDSFYTKHSNNLVFYTGGKNFLVLKDMGEGDKEYQEEFKKTFTNLHYNLQKEFSTEITIGVGNYKNGIAGLKESFLEAKTSLQFGKQIWGEGKIYHYDNFGVIAPLFGSANNENISFSKEVIVRVKKVKELYKTLTEYLDSDLSIATTAKRLKIHRNTLMYRLEKIRQITDLDPTNFEGAFQLKMAIILDKYHG